jgi:hypothetical protein
MSRPSSLDPNSEPPRMPRVCSLSMVLCCWALGLMSTLSGAEPPVQPAPQRLPAVDDTRSSGTLASFLQPMPQGNDTPVPVNPTSQDYWTHWGAKGRAFYLNDQRVEFTGLEATFAVQGVLNGGVHQRVGDWELMAESEFFLNQPADKNQLHDDPIRRSFAANFDVDPFEISQLYVAARKNDVFLQAGRFVTPFGRFYYPIYLNNFSDSPFIRSEAILYRETGLLAQWAPDGFVFTAALTNGGFQQDTNSSKAFIARAGIDRESFACGASIKRQDGVGSEQQKQFNNHVGVDAMVRSGNWTLSGEVIYDEYGFRRPGFDPNNIFWGRSIYFRDLSSGVLEKPLTGVGYYVNLGYAGDRWTWMLNYGDFYPRQALGQPLHDTPNHRGLLKASYHFTRNFEMYGVALIENSVFGLDNRWRRGEEVIGGFQFSM